MATLWIWCNLALMLRLYNSINQKALFPQNDLFILDCCELMRLVWDLQISTSVRQFYFWANSCIVFSSWPLLKSIHKGGLPIFPTSSIIYQFICQFEADYIERTTQLQENWLQLPNMYQCVLEKVDWKNLHKCPITSKAAISEHLIKSWDYASSFCEDMFSVLNGSYFNYHLSVL